MPPAVSFQDNACPLSNKQAVSHYSETACCIQIKSDYASFRAAVTSPNPPDETG